MKRLLQLGLIMGFAGALAAVYFTPWIRYERYASEANVIANGGRSEQFLIRLPSDLIQAGPVTPHHGASDGAQGAEAAPPGPPNAPAVLIEHFKLRDVNGNVLGVAARHFSSSESTAAWLLAIPSRGTLVAVGEGSSPRAIETALGERGWRPGTDFAANLTLELTPRATGVAATGEFEGIDLRLTEARSVTGVDSDGVVRGTITLGTIGTRKP